MHTEWLTQYGPAGVFAGLALGIVGVPVPDETLLVASGYLIYKGTFAVLPTCAAAFLGGVCGITISYVLGRTLGLRVVRRFGRLLHVGPEKLERVHGWFARSGKWLLAGGYYIPGIRHLTALVAGTSRMPGLVFGLFAYLGAFLWTQTFIFLGYSFGEHWHRTAKTFAHHRNITVAVTALMLMSLVAGRTWWRRRRSSTRNHC